MSHYPVFWGKTLSSQIWDLEYWTDAPSMPIKSSGRIVPPGWAPLQPKQSVLSLIV